jgi:hypothetical protein
MDLRDFFGKALFDAAKQMVRDQGKNPVFAAPLAVRVLGRIKETLRPEVQKTLSKTLGLVDTNKLKLTGDLFGPHLYPDRTHSEWSRMKFRQFLDAFPEIVEILPGHSGDMVRVLNVEADDRGEISTLYRSLLLRTLEEQLSRTSESLIPISQLAIWLGKANKTFNIARLGYSSLLEWLQNVPEVQIQRDGVDIRVGRSSIPFEEEQTEKLTAYLLVDSSDILAALHEIIGSKPSPSQLPDWGKVLQFCRNKWPQFDWKGHYFLASSPSENKPLESFIHYLEAVGFKKVWRIAFEEDLSDFERSRQERRRSTYLGIEKALAHIRDQGRPGAVIVASHNADLFTLLQQLLRKTDPKPTVGALAFVERFPSTLSSLKREGLVLMDIERECNAFKIGLGRRVGLAPDDITADDIL